MFTIAKEPTFTHTVKVHVPVDGGHQEQTLKATFRVIEEADDSDPDLSGVELQKAELRRRIVQLGDLVGEDGKPIDYSDALRDQLLAVPYVRLALQLSYIEAVTKAKSGN